MKSKKKGKANDRAEYVMIYESELQVIAGEAALKGNLETGGDLFGAETRGGRSIFYLATGPGPNATHQSTHFAQDFDTFLQVNATLEHDFGLQWKGTWHSHHGLGLSQPSEGDVRQVQSVAQNNGFTRWSEMIVTHGDGWPTSQATSNFWKKNSSVSPRQIRVDAFVYTDPQKGLKVSAPIRVMPGMSPFRLALLAHSRLDRELIGENSVCFPSQRITYDAVATTTAKPTQTSELPVAVAAQLSSLPVEAQEKVSLHITEGFIVVTVCLPDERTLHVGLSPEDPNRIQAVYLSPKGTDNSDDVTSQVVATNRKMTLNDVYAIVTRTGAEETHVSRGRIADAMEAIASRGYAHMCGLTLDKLI